MKSTAPSAVLDAPTTKTATGTLLVGLDLGTNTTCLLASPAGSADTSVREMIPSVVGTARSGIIDGVLPGNATVFFGQDALRHKMHLDLVRPLKGGVIADLDSARLFARHLRTRLNTGPAVEIRAVVGVPAKADPAAREALRQAFAGVFDRVLFIPEPFLATLGSRDESRLNDPDYVDPVRNSLFVDIGAGSTDVCLVQGCYPGADDLLSTTFAGDAVDAIIAETLAQNYPDAQLSPTRIRELKERHSFVMTAEGPICADTTIAGKNHRLDITDAIGAGCDALLRHVFDLVKQVVARAEPESVPELLQNIVLTGGGSLIRSFGVALQTLLVEDGFENPKVAVIGANYKEVLARGALKAARQAKDRQWQKILR